MSKAPIVDSYEEVSTYLVEKHTKGDFVLSTHTNVHFLRDSSYITKMTRYLVDVVFNDDIEDRSSLYTFMGDVESLLNDEVQCYTFEDMTNAYKRHKEILLSEEPPIEVCGKSYHPYQVWEALVRDTDLRCEVNDYIDQLVKENGYEV